MATMASSARDIPKPFGRDSFAAVAARSVPLTKGILLPTPPNSISPSLPPHNMKPYGTRSTTPQIALDQVESDLDLQDEADRNGQDGLAEHDIGSPGFDSAGNITSNLLAKHHLPEILLAHSPLAIRYILGYLTTSVPGFSGIPPTKARRLVVGALEGRGTGTQFGGINGDVRFEKVGWGRWDAKFRGRAYHGRKPQLSPPPSNPSSYTVGIPITRGGGFSFDRTRLHAQGSSWTGDSAAFSHDEETAITMLEHEADKMSLDGDASCSSSEAPPDDEIIGDDPDDMTDEEDWAAVGASALRAASYSASGQSRDFLHSRPDLGGSQGGGGPSLSALAKSVPQRALDQPNNFDLSAFGLASDSQEREAIEALLRLGSV